MANKVDLDKVLEVTGDTNLMTGETTWSSQVEREFKKRQHDMSLAEMAAAGLITDAFGVPCEPAPASKKSKKEQAEYYNAWMKQALKDGGLMFYDSIGATEGKAVRYDKKKQTLNISGKSYLPKPVKKPGYWERRRDRKLREAGKPGTPKMIAYRKALAARDQAALDRQAHYEYITTHLAPITEMRKRSMESLERLSKMDPAKFDEKARQTMLNDMANIMVADAFRRIEKDDPRYAGELLSEIGDELKNKGPVKYFGDREKELVRMNGGAISNPADIKAFLEGKNNTMADAYMANVRVQRKDILAPDLTFSRVDKDQGGKVVEDIEATEAYAELCGKASEALERLKEAASTYQVIPGNKLEQVKEDIAVLSLQNAVARMAKAGDGEQVNNMLHALGVKSDNKSASFTNMAVTLFKNRYVKDLNVEQMTGKDLGKFLINNGEQKISSQYLMKNKPIGKEEKEIKAFLDANLNKTIHPKQKDNVAADVKKQLNANQPKADKNQSLSIENTNSIHF